MELDPANPVVVLCVAEMALAGEPALDDLPDDGYRAFVAVGIARLRRGAGE